MLATVTLGFSLSDPTVAASRQPTARESASNRVVMFDYATCVVKLRHARAAEVILSNVDVDRISREYPDLIDGPCLISAANGEAQMTVQGDLYRYALADALVNIDLAGTVEASFVDRPTLAHLDFLPPQFLVSELDRAKSRRRKDVVQREFAEHNQKAWLSRYGECIVRNDPPNAKAWLMVRPEVAEESENVAALNQTFSKCMNEGETFTFNRLVMRGVIAINYYRLAMAKPTLATGN
jgi:hypothetical protein